MLIQYFQWVVFAFSMILFLIYFKAGFSIIKDAKRSMSKIDSGYSYTISMLFIGAGLVIFITQPFVCLGYINVSSWADRWQVVVPGAVLSVVGITLQFWVRYCFLGRFWSGAVEIQAAHKIISFGPYRIVRHPLYALNLLIYPGVALTFSVWWNWLACIAVIIGYLGLTLYEDSFLEENLPGYKEYQKQTRYLFLPGIW